MLTRSTTLTRYARFEDSLHERNHIDNDLRFFVKHQDQISVVPKLFQSLISILREIYHSAGDPTRTHRLPMVVHG